MLKKLIQLVSQGSVVTPGELARSLGVSQELVESALESLTRAGYLRPVEGCAIKGCQGCTRTGGCSADGTRVWVIPVDPGKTSS